MPKVYEEDGYQLYIFTNDHNPPHVHVRVGGDGEVVINLDETASLRKAYNVKTKEIRKAQEMVLTHREKLLAAWIGIFGS